MPKKALILVEAASNGSDYVQAAQRLGLHPITLSANPDQYNYLAAENLEAIQVNTDDLDAMIRECYRLRDIHDIAGITSSSESFYATIGKLCQRFDLPGPDPSSIEQCCDKFTQRQLLAKGGIPVPAYRLAANATDVEIFAAEVGLPVVIKPAVGGGGSIGVRLCRNIDELAEHMAFLSGNKHLWRSSPKILVEEFVQGQLYCVELMGNEVAGITANDFGPLPHFVACQCSLPAPLSPDEHECITDVSLSCLRALGLGWGPTNIEFRWTKRGPVVIEVNPRLGGPPDPQLLRLAYGIDLITEHIKLVIGGEYNLNRTHSQAAAARFLVPDRDGTLDWIRGHSRAAAVSGVVEVKLYVEPKSPIVRKGDYRDWIGHVVATSAKTDETKRALQRAVDLIDWSITPFGPLAGSIQSATP